METKLTPSIQKDGPETSREFKKRSFPGKFGKAKAEIGRAKIKLAYHQKQEHFLFPTSQLIRQTLPSLLGYHNHQQSHC